MKPFSHKNEGKSLGCFRLPFFDKEFDFVGKRQAYGAQCGFSLVEVIVVISIVGVLSYFAVAKLGNSHASIQYETMANRLASDVRYAREHAFSQGKGTSVFIDQSNNRYSLKWDDGSYLENPVGGGDFLVQLGAGEFPGVLITGTSFNGGRLDFNKAGLPLNSGIAFSGTLTLVKLNDEKRILITSETALVRVEDM